MAASRPSSIQDQMADVTECFMCMEVYANPKILPCVHTFCLECLEKYGRDKEAGDHMACPICKNEFLIPDEGFCSLPHNFFIDKMVEIRKLSETSTNEAMCGTCPDEDRIKAKMFCFECEHNLCERCVIAHKKIKFCQNHQVVEIGNKLKPQEVTFRNSCCDQHPGELVKMYCVDDKATICFLCFAESHQSHKCLSVTKASEEFSSARKNDLKTIIERLPEFEASIEQFDKWRKDLLAQSGKIEKQIFDEAGRLKELIDLHAKILMQTLTAAKEKKLKEIYCMKQDMERFKATFESYTKYSDELLSRGAPGDICREADQLKTRARELALLTTNCCDQGFSCDGITFKSLNLEDVLHTNNITNVIGDVQAGTGNDCILPFFTDDAVIRAITSKQLHFEKKQVKVESYDLAKTDSEISTSLTLAFDPRAVYFILKRPELQKHIEISLKKLNCCIVWPSEGKGEVKLEYHGKDKQKRATGWDAECRKVLQRYADELTWKRENSLQEIWNDFKKKIQEYASIKSKLLDCAFESDQCEIQYIGLKKDTDEFEKIFRKIEAELEEELKQRKKRISETVTSLRPLQLALIRTEEFQKKLKQELPDIDFEVKQTEVNLCGMPDVVKKSRLFIMEKVSTAAQDSLEGSETMSKVFAKEAAKPYLMEQLLHKGISATWICNDRRSVVVYALDDKNLKEAVKVLKSEVVEARLKLSAVNLPNYFGQSQQWKDLIRCLREEDKSLELDVDDSFIVVACMRSSIEKSKRRIEDFIIRHDLYRLQNNVPFRFYIQGNWQ